MKLYIVTTILIFFMGCSNSTSNNSEEKTSSDSTTLMEPAAADSTRQPSGMDNSSVISTDTAAMNHQNAIKKTDSLKKQMKK